MELNTPVHHLSIHTPTQELVSGEPVLVDLSEESDGEDQDFDSWKPDPVDADPSE